MEYILYNIKNNKLIIIDKNEVFDKLYFLECRVPTKDDIIYAIKNKNVDEKILKFIKSDNEANIINIIKDNISKIEDKMPLYDVYTDNIYLIGKHNVYWRVVYQYYRFPDEHIIDELKKKYDEYKNEMNDKMNDKIFMRKIRKLELMIEFMNYFNIKILYETYIKIFYKYSDFVGKQITMCKNPSFMSHFVHIQPYFTRNQIINLALNYKIDVPKKYIENEDVTKLCSQIKKNQITWKTLLNHQNYILDSGNLGMVQYYTLQGSYFMNKYLRDKSTSYQNKYLETLIKPMWDLVLHAPAFDKSYILYRFVQEDSYLRHLKIGDVFIEDGFMSTTRDPFYRSDMYKFGFILIKIRIPAEKNGIALCLETVSHFPEEQEIIFPPKSKFKLLNTDEDCLYYHTDAQFSSKVKTKYEFEWVENDSIKFDQRKEYNTINDVNFLKIEKSEGITLDEKITYFENNYVNKNGQFEVNIDDNKFIVIAERYNSISAYKKFYAIETETGFSLYSIYKGFILFFIEIGESNNELQMHVNYYTRYSSIDPNKIIGDENLIKLYSSIAYYFKIPTVVIYATYMNCDNNINIQYGGGKIQRNFAFPTKQIENNYVNDIKGGSYCVDLYEYLLNGTKKYTNLGILNVELYPRFSYFDLDILKNTDPLKILDKTDRDELYQIYDKAYISNNKNTIADFYIWIKNNRCYLLDQYISKIDRLLKNNNPFRNDMYILDPDTYLYNRKYIPYYPSNINIQISVKREVLSNMKENRNPRS